MVEVPLADISKEQVLACTDGAERALQDMGDRLFIFSDEARQLRERLEGLGIVITLRPATLEDVFIRLTGTALGE